MSSGSVQHCTHAACLEVLFERAGVRSYRVRPPVVVAGGSLQTAADTAARLSLRGVDRPRRGPGTTAACGKCTLCYDRLKGHRRPRGAKASRDGLDPVRASSTSCANEGRPGGFARLHRAGREHSKGCTANDPDEAVGRRPASSFLLLDEPEVYRRAGPTDRHTRDLPAILWLGRPAAGGRLGAALGPAAVLRAGHRMTGPVINAPSWKPEIPFYFSARRDLAGASAGLARLSEGSRAKTDSARNARGRSPSPAAWPARAIDLPTSATQAASDTCCGCQGPTSAEEPRIMGAGPIRNRPPASPRSTSGRAAFLERVAGGPARRQARPPCSAAARHLHRGALIANTAVPVWTRPARRRIPGGVRPSGAAGQRRSGRRSAITPAEHAGQRGRLTIARRRPKSAFVEVMEARSTGSSARLTARVAGAARLGPVRSSRAAGRDGRARPRTPHLPRAGARHDAAADSSRALEASSSPARNRPPDPAPDDRAAKPRPAATPVTGVESAAGGFEALYESIVVRAPEVDLGHCGIEALAESRQDPPQQRDVGGNHLGSRRGGDHVPRRAHGGAAREAAAHY